jgi:hypothetical protein
MAKKSITGKQCQQARNLLKWNQRDLSTRASLDAKKIDSFEKGVVRLQKGEMEGITSAFYKEDVMFKGNFEVELKKKTTQTTRVSGEQTVHDATADYMDEIERQDKRRKKRVE